MSRWMTEMESQTRLFGLGRHPPRANLQLNARRRYCSLASTAAASLNTAMAMSMSSSVWTVLM